MAKKQCSEHGKSIAITNVVYTLKLLFLLGALSLLKALLHGKHFLRLRGRHFKKHYDFLELQFFLLDFTALFHIKGLGVIIHFDRK